MKTERKMQSWISFIWCPVKNTIQNFKMRTVCQKSVTPTAPCMASCSTAPAVPKMKSSGCAKIGSWRKTAATQIKNTAEDSPQWNWENPRRCPFNSLVVLLIYSFLVKDILYSQKSPVYFVFKIQLRIFNIPMIWSRIWRDLWLFCSDVHWTVGDFLCKNLCYGCII